MFYESLVVSHDNYKAKIHSEKSQNVKSQKITIKQASKQTNKKIT